METEKILEIKKALKIWNKGMGYFDEKHVFHSVKHSDILDYINELEKDNNELRFKLQGKVEG